MLQSLKQLYGDKLGASDGEIGQVKDFYFDDQTWAVRYLVADTGTWLDDRQVLLAPKAFGHFQETAKILRVNLTRPQIEKSPSIDLHKPVSRQYEEEYHRYYDWPFYWQAPPAAGSTPANLEPLKNSDARLRSAQAVTGYHIMADDGNSGHVCDFLMDAKNWTIRQLVVKTGHRFSGKEVEIPVSQVNRISYDDSTVFVNLTMAAVEQSPAPLKARD